MGVGSLTPTSWHAAQESWCPQLHVQREVSGAFQKGGSTTTGHASPTLVAHGGSDHSDCPGATRLAVSLPLRMRSGWPRARGGPRTAALGKAGGRRHGGSRQGRDSWPRLTDTLRRHFFDPPGPAEPRGPASARPWPLGTLLRRGRLPPRRPLPVRGAIPGRCSPPPVTGDGPDKHCGLRPSLAPHAARVRDATTFWFPAPPLNGF